MTKEEVLKYLGLKELPESSEATTAKCIVLVDRVNKTKDYAIAFKNGIVVDKNSVSAIIGIVEYYPVVLEKKVKEQPKKIEESTKEVVSEEKIIVEEKPIDKIPAVKEVKKLPIVKNDKGQKVTKPRLPKRIKVKG